MVGDVLRCTPHSLYKAVLQNIVDRHIRVYRNGFMTCHLARTNLFYLKGYCERGPGTRSPPPFYEHVIDDARSIIHVRKSFMDFHLYTLHREDGGHYCEMYKALLKLIKPNIYDDSYYINETIYKRIHALVGGRDVKTYMTQYVSSGNIPDLVWANRKSGKYQRDIIKGLHKQKEWKWINGSYHYVLRDK